MQDGLKVSTKFKWEDIRNSKHKGSPTGPYDINLFGYEQVTSKAIYKNKDK